MRIPLKVRKKYCLPCPSFRMMKTLWEGIKTENLLTAFQKNRKISVFTEWNLFVWMVGKVMTKLKGYRKKDLDILKLLVKLTGTKC